MTGYIYVFLWFAVGLLLLFRFGKENKVFYPLGGFFLLLGVWWLVDTLQGGMMFEDVWGWVLRLVTAGALVLACTVYYKETKRSREEDEARKREQAQARQAAMLPRDGEPLSEKAGDDMDAPGENGPQENSDGPGADAPGGDSSGGDADGE